MSFCTEITVATLGVFKFSYGSDQIWPNRAEFYRQLVYRSQSFNHVISHMHGRVAVRIYFYGPRSLEFGRKRAPLIRGVR